MLAYPDSTVRTAASDTASTWVGGRKRDWENAFLTKFSDLEATLQENDRWLALYWDNIASMKGAKKSDMAITAALKTSSTKRRARSRIDIRDVFAGSVRGGGDPGVRQQSPLMSQFSTSSRRSLRAKRRSSHFGAGHTLSMAMAQMAMMPPKSPYLTNVGTEGVPPVPPVPPAAQRQTSTMSLRTQRSRELAVTAEPEPLTRSNSAAAKTAAAVKRLQAMSGSSPPAKRESTPAQLATPPSSANMPAAATGPATTPASAPAPTSPPRSARFTPAAPMPTLRDMLLSHRNPPASTRSQSSQPVAGIDTALHGLTLEAKQQLKYRQTASQASSQQSSPERVLAHPRPLSATSSEGEQEMTKSEEDVREGLQRVRIAMGRNSMGRGSEEPEDVRVARQRISSIEAALSPGASDAELAALCRDIDAVANMLPPSRDASQASDDGDNAERLRFVDVEIDQQPIDVGLGAAEAESAELSGKRKHSDEETSSAGPAPAVSSRLLAPTAASLARGRGRGKPRAGLHAATGIPRQPGRIPPRSDSRLDGRKLANPPKARVGAAPSATGIRVAEARRKFESPTVPADSAGPASGASAKFSSPVAAMRPGYTSIVQTPAAAAATAGNTQKKRLAPRAAAKSSTAAMREAARKAASARKQPAARSGNEPLFKSVAAKPSQSSLRAQASREQLAKPPRNPAPTPTASDSSSAIPMPASAKGKQPDASSSAIPIPASAKGKQPDASEAAEAGGWGLSSVLSILSPSSWTSQASGVSDAAAQHSGAPETPTQAPPLRAGVGSPYDMHSPQNPYQPRPEHGGAAGGQLMMPSYHDVSVPLRRSSGSDRASLSSAGGSAGAARESQHLRLLHVKEGGRVSGMSSIRSSFFSDDESSAGTVRRRSLARTQSTSDLPRRLQHELETPAPALRRRPSARSSEYTSIIPAGSNSPPEIESDYSDEYSDEEFTPTVKRKKNDFRIPTWATTPELLRGLESQSRVNPDRIFGKVRPIRVNEIFNRREDADTRRRPRNSSMIWEGSDALTADDELEYIRRMGFDQ